MSKVNNMSRVYELCTLFKLYEYFYELLKIT